MNAADEVETWWTRCVVIYLPPFESARARVCKKSDTTPRACGLGQVAEPAPLPATPSSRTTQAETKGQGFHCFTVQSAAAALPSVK